MNITLNGTTQPITKWALDYGIPVKLIVARIESGWSEERAITEPMRVTAGSTLPFDAMVRPKRCVSGPAPQLVEFNGEALTIKQWAARLGLYEVTLRARLLNRNWTLERALTTGNIRAQCERTPKLIEFNGEALTKRAWAERLGITHGALAMRLRRHPVEVALAAPCGRTPKRPRTLGKCGISAPFVA